VVGPHRADVDEGRGLFKHRVLTYPPIISTDISLADARIQKALIDSGLKWPWGGQMIPDVALDANDIGGPDQLLPGRCGISCLKEGGYCLVQHLLQDIRAGRTIPVDGLLFPDQNYPALRGPFQG